MLVADSGQALSELYLDGDIVVLGLSLSFSFLRSHFYYFDGMIKLCRIELSNKIQKGMIYKPQCPLTMGNKTFFKSGAFLQQVLVGVNHSEGQIIIQKVPW